MTAPADPEPKADSVDQVASTLNQLIRTCKDGEEGFQVAAESVDDLNLRHLLESYSQQRSEFAAELQREVLRLNQSPSDSGHLSASVHRGWMEIKAIASARDEGSIIAECERGEDLAVKSYQQALESDLTPDLKALVERQFLKVKEAHEQFRSLEQVHGRNR